MSPSTRKAEQEALGRISYAAEEKTSVLDLSGLDISHVPTAIGELAKLKELYLHDNHLTTVPELLGQLTELEVLDLHNNQLKTLPEALSQLAQLQTLALGGNKLTTVSCC